MAKLIVQPFAKVPNEYVSVERSRALTLLEEKLVYMTINTMQKRWESTKKLDRADYDFIANSSVTIKEFIETMQIGDNKKQIRQSIKDISIFGVAIYTEHTDRFMTVFKEFYVDYKKGTIDYKFNDVFVQYFTGIARDYFKLSIEEVIGLNSSHAIRVYQLLKTKQNMHNHIVEYSIIELKKLLNIEKKYILYSNFKQKILETVKQQINNAESSQFNIDYKEAKTGRAVTSIQFEILPKIKNHYLENNQLAKYQIDLLKKLCTKWKKETEKTSVVNILACKILEELKHKKILLVVIKNYLDVIKLHIDDDLTNLNL